MSPTKSPAPGVVPQRPGSMDYGSSSSAKVIPLRPNDKGADTGGPFDQLTARLLLAQLRAGTLPEGVFVAMMASAGLQP